MLQVWLLGQFEIKLDGRRVVLAARAAQSLLAYLMLSAGTPHRRERLAGLFWGDLPDENARRNLRHEVWRIRKALAAPTANAEYLLADEQTLAFNREAEYWLDAAQFQNPELDLEALTSNLSLYRGELLPGMYDDWVTLERERLQAVFEGKMQTLLEKLLDAQRWNTAIEWSERWIAQGQTPEPAYRALMVGYAATGNRAQIVATYERCRDILKNELGVEPSDETNTLYEQIIHGQRVGHIDLTPMYFARARLPFHAEPPAPGEPPFKGLEFFDESDADLFFGREQLTAKLIQGLRASQFLAVVIGASGSGKSSIVRAGVVPALKNGTPLADGTLPPADSQTWTTYILTPTAHPLEALATALTRDTESVTAATTLLDELIQDPRALHVWLQQQIADGEWLFATCHSPSAIRHLLLVIDQFEELFTLCHDEFEREQFIDNVLTALAYENDGQLTIILTLRADFYTHLAQYPELREAVAKHQEFIGPMTSDELRRAMQEPAKQRAAADGTAWEFEPGLVDLILRDVASPSGSQEPGALPLLSHALLETWKRRSGHTLTLQGYHDAGGVRGAIAQTAESVYQQFTPEERIIARDIFLRLTELGEGTEDTRRRASFDELIPHDENAASVYAVLRRLADVRLITLHADSAEVAHEALIREWSQLREWLNQDREGLRLHRQITQDAQEWEMLEQDASALYRGTRLAQALEWAANAAHINQTERAFLDAAVADAERAEREKEAARQRELEHAQTVAAAERQRAAEQAASNQKLRRRALILAGVVVLAFCAAGAALFFLTQSNANLHTASEQRAEANAQRDTAEKAQAEAEKQQRIGLARELAANSLANLDVDAERSILLALQAIVTTRQVDGTVLPEAEEALHRAVDTSRVFRTIPNLVKPDQIAFSPDGARIAIRGAKMIWVWDVVGNKQLFALPLTSDHADRIFFSADSKQLVTLDASDAQQLVAKTFDLETGNILRSVPLDMPSTDWLFSAFSPNMTRVVIDSANGFPRVYDLQSGKLLFELDGHVNSYGSAGYSPDGKRIATTQDDGRVQLWDAATGKLASTLIGHSAGVLGIAFSADGTRIAIGGDDRTAKVWDATTGQMVFTLRGHNDWVSNVALSADASRIATLSLDGKTKVWDGKTGQELMTLTNPIINWDGLALSEDGTRLATLGAEGTVKIWDLTPSHEALTIPTGGPLGDGYWYQGSAVYSPDGKYLAAGLQDGSIKLWDALTGQERMILKGHRDAVNQVAFSPDGSLLASAGADGMAKIWELTTGKPVQTFYRASTEFGNIAISPNNQFVATSSLDKTAVLWELHSGKQVWTFSIKYPDNVFGVTFSPDGSLLKVGFSDGSLSTYNLKTNKTESLASGETDGVGQIVYSPDGSKLAISGGDRPIVIDAATGQKLFTFGDIGAKTNDIAYSPDGTRLATGHVDGTARLWSAATGQEQLTLYGNPLIAQSVAFSPDGTRLAVATDQDIRVFLLRVQDLIALAKTRVTRSLTQEECVKYLHQPICPPNH